MGCSAAELKLGKQAPSGGSEEAVKAEAGPITSARLGALPAGTASNPVSLLSPEAPAAPQGARAPRGSSPTGIAGQEISKLQQAPDPVTPRGKHLGLASSADAAAAGAAQQPVLAKAAAVHPTAGTTGAEATETGLLSHATTSRAATAGGQAQVEHHLAPAPFLPWRTPDMCWPRTASKALHRA